MPLDVGSIPTVSTIHNDGGFFIRIVASSLLNCRERIMMYMKNCNLCCAYYEDEEEPFKGFSF